MDFTLEELSMNAWPALRTVLYDGWIIRFANGYSNRSNSVNPIYPSTINIDQKINYCDFLFAGCNLPATFKIIGCKEHDELEKKLEELRYQKIHLTSVQTSVEMEILKRNYEGIIIKDYFDSDWMAGVIEFNGIKEVHQPTFKALVNNIGVEKIVVSKETKDGIVGCGYGALDNNYVGIFDIVVKDSERGKGYGKEIVKSLLSEARKRGIGKSFLQVMENNNTARKLYEGLGFKEVYKYWYRKKANPRDGG